MTGTVMFLEGLWELIRTNMLVCLGGIWGLRPMDNFQKFLALQFHQGTLLIQDNYYQHGSAISQAYPRCMLSNTAVLYALVIA